MRIALLLAWLAVPIGFAFYHYGPGQDDLKNDLAGVAVTHAARFATFEDWEAAEDAYSKALNSLAADQTTANQQIRLERAKARMNSQQLPAAYDDLTALLEELQADQNADANLLADARASMANAEYYVTWLMRLEGEPRDAWELEIESARQTYRLLAEQAVAAGDEEAAEKYSEDLEAAIRLARMDLSELEALDLPSQCKGCCSGDCNCKCKKPGKKPGGKKKVKDARGASSGPPADGTGS